MYTFQCLSYFSIKSFHYLKSCDQNSRQVPEAGSVVYCEMHLLDVFPQHSITLYKGVSALTGLLL